MGKVEYRKCESWECPKDDPWRLEETIAADCEYWERIVNQDAMIEQYMYLNECKSSKHSGMYQLILNGTELWWGTLQEINAVVKSMAKLAKEADKYMP